MADFDKVIVDGVSYTVKDTTARDSVDTLASAVADGYIPNEGNATDDEFLLNRDTVEIQALDVIIQSTNSDVQLNAPSSGGVLMQGGVVSVETTQSDITVTTNNGGDVVINCDDVFELNTVNLDITVNGSDLDIVCENGSGFYVSADNVVDISASDDINLTTTQGGNVAINCNSVLQVNADTLDGSFNDIDINVHGSDFDLTCTNGSAVYVTSDGYTLNSHNNVSLNAMDNSSLFINTGDKAYYNGLTANDEIATVGDITSATGNFIPNDGNNTNDDLTLSRGAISIRTKAQSDFEVDSTGDISLIGSGANSSVALYTTGIGQATYNGVEIATVSDVSTATAGYIPNAGNTTADGLNITRTGGAINLISTDGQGGASSFSMTQTGDTSIGGTGNVSINGPGNISGSVGGNVSLTGGSGVYLNGGGSYGDFGKTTANKITISNGSSSLTIDNSISSPRTTLTNTADVMLQVGNGNMHLKSESLTGSFNSGHQLLTNYTINSGYLRNLNGANIEAGVYNSLLSTSLTNAINTPNKNDFHLKVYGADGGTIARNLVFGNCPNYAQYFTFDNVVFSNVVDTLMYNDNTNALERFIEYKGCEFEHTTAPITSPTISKGTITFENCIFDGDLQVLLQGDYSVNIINCVFKGTTGIDVQLASGATWTGKGVITGNHFTNGGAVAIATGITGIENWNNV